MRMMTTTSLFHALQLGLFLPMMTPISVAFASLDKPLDENTPVKTSKEDVVSSIACPEKYTGQIIGQDGSIPFPRHAVQIYDWHGDEVEFVLRQEWKSLGAITWMGLEYDFDDVGVVCDTKSQLNGQRSILFAGNCYNETFEATLYVHDETWPDSAYESSIHVTDSKFDHCNPPQFQGKLMRYKMRLPCNKTCEYSATAPALIASDSGLSSPSPPAYSSRKLRRRKRKRKKKRKRKRKKKGKKNAKPPRRTPRPTNPPTDVANNLILTPRPTPYPTPSPTPRPIPRPIPRPTPWPTPRPTPRPTTPYPTTSPTAPPTRTPRIPPTRTPRIPPTRTPRVPPTSRPNEPLVIVDDAGGDDVAPPTRTPRIPPTRTPRIPPTRTPRIPPTRAPRVPPTSRPNEPLVIADDAGGDDVAPPTRTPRIPPTRPPRIPPTRPPRVPPTGSPNVVFASSEPIIIEDDVSFVPPRPPRIPPTGRPNIAPPTRPPRIPPTRPPRIPPTGPPRIPPTRPPNVVFANSEPNIIEDDVSFVPPRPPRIPPTGRPNIAPTGTLDIAATQPTPTLSPTSCYEQQTGQVIEQDGSIPFPKDAIQIFDWSGDEVSFVLVQEWKASGTISWIGLEYDFCVHGMVCDIKYQLNQKRGMQFTGNCFNGTFDGILYVHDSTWSDDVYSTSPTIPNSTFDHCNIYDGKLMRYRLRLPCNRTCDYSAVPSEAPSISTMPTDPTEVEDVENVRKARRMAQSSSKCLQQPNGQVIWQKGSIPFPSNVIDVTSWKYWQIEFSIRQVWKHLGPVTWMGVEYDDIEDGRLCYSAFNITNTASSPNLSFKAICDRGISTMTLYVHDSTWPDDVYDATTETVLIDDCIPFEKVIIYKLQVNCTKPEACEEDSSSIEKSGITSNNGSTDTTDDEDDSTTTTNFIMDGDDTTTMIPAIAPTTNMISDVFIPVGYTTSFDRTTHFDDSSSTTNCLSDIELVSQIGGIPLDQNILPPFLEIVEQKVHTVTFHIKQIFTSPLSLDYLEHLILQYPSSSDTTLNGEICKHMSKIPYGEYLEYTATCIESFPATMIDIWVSDSTFSHIDQNAYIPTHCKDDDEVNGEEEDIDDKSNNNAKILYTFILKCQSDCM